MSLKTTLFQTLVPSPLTTHTFSIIIPGLYQPTILVEAATYPSQIWDEVALPFKGERIYRPTKVATPEPWRIRMPENVLFTVKRELSNALTAIKRVETESDSGDSDSINVLNKRYDIIVTPLGQGAIPLAGVTLVNAWFKERSAVDLQNEDPTIPWKWNLTVRYDYMKEHKVNWDLPLDLVKGVFKGN